MRLLPALAGGVLTLAACAGNGVGSADRPDDVQAPSVGRTAAPAAGSEFGPPVLLGEVADPMLAESSGLAASRRNPGVLWTHNDSGDDPRVFCLTRTARACGTWIVTGAEARDWEDMAVGPGRVAGETDLYVGDIGDNRETRDDVVVYRFSEPVVPGSAGDAGPVEQRTTGPAAALRLRYDDGAHDAEALMVHPTTGDLYVITKDPLGSVVYKAAEGSTVLERMADLDLGLVEVVTGADISPDGRRVVVCTYQQAYELSLPVGTANFDEIWTQHPRRLDLGARGQGEAIAYRLDGGAVLTTSEQTPFPLHEVPRR